MGGPGSGNHLDPILRRLVYDHYINRGKSPIEIYDILFGASEVNSSKITYAHLIKLCKWFLQSEEKENIEVYLSGSNSRAIAAGRPRRLHSEDREHLRTLLQLRCTRNLDEISKELYFMIDNNEIDQLISSVPTIYRELKRMKFTRKVDVIIIIAVP